MNTCVCVYFSVCASRSSSSDDLWSFEKPTPMIILFLSGFRALTSKRHTGSGLIMQTISCFTLLSCHSEHLLLWNHAVSLSFIVRIYLCCMCEAAAVIRPKANTRSGCSLNPSPYPTDLHPYTSSVFVVSNDAVLIEISGASSGEDVEVAKACSLIGMSHAPRCTREKRVCVITQCRKTISNNRVCFKHADPPSWKHTRAARLRSVSLNVFHRQILLLLGLHNRLHALF